MPSQLQPSHSHVTVSFEPETSSLLLSLFCQYVQMAAFCQRLNNKRQKQPKDLLLCLTHVQILYSSKLSECGPIALFSCEAEFKLVFRPMGARTMHSGLPWHTLHPQSPQQLPQVPHNNTNHHCLPK